MTGKGPPKSSNFGFLAKHYPQLELIGARGERYFSDDPVVTLISVRQFGEVLAQLVAARSGLLSDARETQADLLRRLRVDGNYPRSVLDLFHQIRIHGNPATHQGEGDHATALACLKMARQLAIWFYRTFDDHNLKAGPFQPPRPPIDATAELTTELDRLKAERDAALTAAERAKAVAAEAEAARLDAERGAKGAVDEKVLWEQLAAEAEVAKIKLAEQVAMLMAARHPAAAEEYLELEPHVASHHFRVDQAPAPPAMDRGIDEFELAQQLVSLQEAAESSSPAEQQQVLQSAQTAADQINLDEAETRALVDEQLRERGWETDTQNLRYAKGVRPARGKVMAIAEWPTANGPADYALFVGLTCVGLVEAKRKRKNVAAAIDQTGRYAQAFSTTDDIDLPPGGPWPFQSGPTEEKPFRVPFLFATNGRPYLKQVETQSGIWFRDARDPTNLRRALTDWPTPEGLKAQLDVDRQGAQERLKSLPIEFAFSLRDYQKRAIQTKPLSLMTPRAQCYWPWRPAPAKRNSPSRSCIACWRRSASAEYVLWLTAMRLASKRRMSSRRPVWWAHTLSQTFLA